MRANRIAEELHSVRLNLEPDFVHFYDVFQNILRQKQNSVWIDLGCGKNIFVNEFGPNFKYAVGVDADKRLMGVAAHPFVCGNIRRLPFKDNAFDLITTYMTVEHFPEPMKELAEIYRTLKPGGRLVVCTVNKKYWASLLNRVIPECVKRLLLAATFGRKEEDVFPAFYKLNTKNDLEAVLDKTGFSRICATQHTHYFAFSRMFFKLQYFLDKKTAMGRTSLFRNYLIVTASKARA